MTSDPSAQADQLRADIEALRRAIAALAALPSAQQPLREQLAAKERELAALQRDSAPVARSHTQQIGDDAQVGVAIAGDVHGSVTHVEQSGGINFGTGNTIERIGDIVGGDKIGGDKVLGDKHVHFGALLPADTGPDHIQRLIDLNTRRLRVLEEQAARGGYNARPEVLTEIEDIRAEIARLQELLSDK
jgi:hypothetical protein